jgi:glyoxylase-like metal-dependent hydrolase (beta-lactamase superfamily II)
MVDAGLGFFHRNIRHALNVLGDSGRLTQLLITHADGDHYGCANLLKAQNGCNLSASQVEAKAMARGGMSRGLHYQPWIMQVLAAAILPIYKARPVAVDQLLSPGQVLPVFGGLRVLDSAGHTPGHLSFYLPEQKVLFAGDSIVERRGIPSPAFGGNCWDENQAKISFERQMALNPTHLCCGHSYFNLRG